MIHGFVPYRDYFMLVFPFAIQLNAIFLSAFSDQLIVLRLLALFTMTAMAQFLFGTCRALRVSRLASSLPVVVLAAAVVMSPYNSYNWTAMTLLAAAMFGDAMQHRDTGGTNARTTHGHKWALFTGVALGLAILSKQTIGAAGLIVCMLWHILIRRRMRYAAIVAVGFFVVVGAEFAYLYFANALNALVQTNLESRSRFATDAGRPFSDLFRAPASSFGAILVPVFLILPLIGTWLKSRGVRPTAAALVSLYGLAGLVVAYPIADAVHLYFVAPIAAAALCCPVSDVSLATASRSSKVWPSVVLAALFVITPFTERRNLPQRLHAGFTNVPHFKGIPIANVTEKQIALVSQTVLRLEEQGKHVHILEFDAPAFLIPLNRFAERYDVPINGNFGANGVRSTILALAGDRDAAAFIKPGAYALESEELNTFVQKSMQLLDTVAGHSLYVHDQPGAASKP